jgi:hypothetical protein
MTSKLKVVARGWLAAVLWLLSWPIAAQDFRLSTRQALRPDLEAGEMAIEALEAAAAEIGLSTSPLDVAQRLGECAQILSDLGMERDAEDALFFASLSLDLLTAEQEAEVTAGMIGTVHRTLGLDEALAWVDALDSAGARADAIARLLDALWDRGDSEQASELLGGLERAELAEGEAEAWAAFARGFRELGDLAQAESFERAVVESQELSRDPFFYWPAVRRLVRDALARGDYGRGEALLASMATRLREPYPLSEVRNEWLAIVDARLLAGQRAGVRAAADLTVDPGLRCAVLARLAEAHRTAGEAELAEDALARAVALAREAGSAELAILAARVHGAGHAALAQELLAEAHARFLAMKKSGAGSAFDQAAARDGAAKELGKAYLACGRPGELAGVIAEAPFAGADLDELRVTQGLQSAQSFDAAEVAAALKHVDGAFSFWIRAMRIGPVARAAALSPMGERDRALLVAELVRRAREIPTPGEASLALAAIVRSGLATARNPSALHPWSLPPSLEGEWTTPDEARSTAVVQVLLQALAEAGLPEPDVRALRACELRCYTDGTLYEVDGLVLDLPYVYLLLSVEGQTIWLGKDAAALHRLHSAHPPLLASEDQLLEYVRFFSGALGYPGGRFRAIEDPAVLEHLRRPGLSLPSLPTVPLRVQERDAGAARVALRFVAERKLVQSVVRVTSDGRMEMADEATLASGLPIDDEVFAEAVGGFQRVRPEVSAPLALLDEDPAKAAFELGLGFATGFGSGPWARDEDVALRWILRAEAAGRAEALREVADVWSKGSGVPADGELCAWWLARAAERGNWQAALELGTWYAGSPSPKRVLEAKALLEQGDGAGHADCTYQLGVLRAFGAAGLDPDLERGRELFERAALAGHARAAVQLGLFYADANGVERDPGAAARWFAKAGELGSSEGWYFLGILRANGFGEPSQGEALEAHLRAAESGLPAAQVVVALRLRSGLGAPGGADRALALQWSAKAAEAGHRFGMLLRALLLAEGDPAGFEEARALRTRAAGLAQPVPPLRSFVDPGYLVGQTPGEPLDAVEALDAWRAAIDAELGRRLGG